ncbi:hypothetical protein GCM10023162_37450 [Klenkia terrae]
MHLRGTAFEGEQRHARSFTQRTPPGRGTVVAMTTPQSDEPQPRDIALEQETEDQAIDLEEQSDPE